MQYVIIGAATLGVLLGLGQLFVRVDARALLRVLRYVLGAAASLFGVLFLAAGRGGLGLALLAAGIVLLARGRLGPLDFGAGPATPGRSSVSSTWLEMGLDHGSGRMNGRVLAGQSAGKALDDLDEPALRLLREEVAGDPDSVALLEAYLDRRFPGWRDDIEDDAAAGAGGAPDSGAMTDQEAYEVLGLSAGASEADIRAAHRRLMKGVHPDQGGSTFLAGKINQAKDRLLGGHR